MSSDLADWIAAVQERALSEHENPRFRQEGGPFAEYDLLDRKQPRHPGLHDYLLTIARVSPGRVRRVPSQAVEEEFTDEDGPYSLVSCPCGARPVVRAELEKCTGCERYYVLVGTIAFVAYGAMTPP